MQGRGPEDDLAMRLYNELFEAFHECGNEIRLASSEPADVIKAANGFAVAGKAPPSIAARLRMCEKSFVIDHSESLGPGDPEQFPGVRTESI